MIHFFHVSLTLDALFIFFNDREVIIKVMVILVQGMISASRAHLQEYKIIDTKLLKQINVDQQ